MKTFFDAVFIGDKQAIILLAAIYFAAMGLFSLISCIRIRSWPTTNGALLSFGLDTLGLGMRKDENNYTADVRYSYRVAEKDYEGSRLSPTFIMVSTNLRFVLNWQMRGIKKLGGDQVAVLYNPSKPEKSFLIRPGMVTVFQSGNTAIGGILRRYGIRLK